ncbi:MAG: DNA mismatch repair endonuclease MutL [Eubacteriales bacterium]
MGKINILGFDVANLIAAGEVVDRPSSVVKELLENALDAGSTAVTIEIQHGGVTFIRVADNGCGMDTDDLPTAILRHATSKIKTAEDLSDITTLGFRGEALAAIASVSRLRIFSKVRENPFGALLESDGGEIVSVTETGCADGTTVIVEDLFFNVPARRKFLKKDSTEAIAVGTVVEKIALSRPDVSLKYISDGEIKFMTAGNGNLSETIWALFGRETARRLLKVDREENGIHITGYVSEPDLVRANRNMQNFFINGRYVKSKTASAALEQAYTSKIPSDRFPSCVLNIGLNPAAVDVNVHPAKLEVKFANEKLIFDAVYYAVRTALEAGTSRPELQVGRTLGGGAAPEPPSVKPRVSGMTVGELKNAFVPADQKPSGTLASRQIGIAPAKRPAAQTEPAPKAKESAKPSEPARPKMPDGSDMSYLDMLHLHREAMERADTALSDSARAAPLRETEKVQPVQEPDVQEAPPSESAPEDHGEIPDYLILGEAYNCYVIVQLEDRLLIIDKHAAHERILFDELCRKLKKREKNGQLLLTPYELTVSNAEADALADYGEQIRALGFDYTVRPQSAASQKAAVTQIPEELSAEEAAVLFTTLAARLSDVTASVESAAAEFFESRLWQASCKAAIKGGRIYDTAHLRWICDRLLVRPGPNGTGSVIRTCPHGRPVAFELKKTSIEKQFERS